MADVREVVVSVDLGRYRVMVHYADCNLRPRIHTHHGRTVPPSIKWKLCHWCEPQVQDILTVAPDITWLEKKADAMSMTTFYGFDEVAENIDARTQLYDEGRFRGLDRE